MNDIETNRINEKVEKFIIGSIMISIIVLIGVAITTILWTIYKYYKANNPMLYKILDNLTPTPYYLINMLHFLRDNFYKMNELKINNKIIKKVEKIDKKINKMNHMDELYEKYKSTPQYQQMYTEIMKDENLKFVYNTFMYIKKQAKRYFKEEFGKIFLVYELMFDGNYFHIGLWNKIKLVFLDQQQYQQPLYPDQQYPQQYQQPLYPDQQIPENEQVNNENPYAIPQNEPQPISENEPVNEENSLADLEDKYIPQNSKSRKRLKRIIVNNEDDKIKTFKHWNKIDFTNIMTKLNGNIDITIYTPNTDNYMKIKDQQYFKYLNYEYNSKNRPIISALLLNRNIDFNNLGITDIDEYLNFFMKLEDFDNTMIKNIIIKSKSKIDFSSMLKTYEKIFSKKHIKYITDIIKYQQEVDNMFIEKCRGKELSNIYYEQSYGNDGQKKPNFINSIVDKIANDIVYKNKDNIKKIDEFLYQHGITYTVYMLLLLNVMYKITILNELYIIHNIYEYYPEDAFKKEDMYDDKYYSSEKEQEYYDSLEACNFAFGQGLESSLNYSDEDIDINKEDIHEYITPINSETLLLKLIHGYRSFNKLCLKHGVHHLIAESYNEQISEWYNNFVVQCCVFIKYLVYKYIDYIKANNYEYDYKQYKIIMTLVHTMINYVFASDSIIYNETMYNNNDKSINDKILDCYNDIFNIYQESYINKVTKTNPILKIVLGIKTLIITIGRFKPHEILGINPDIFDMYYLEKNVKKYILYKLTKKINTIVDYKDKSKK